MPYIDRDPAGNIIGVYEGAQRDGQEFAETAEIYTPPPTKEQQIAALLAVRGETRLTVQMAIQTGELIATLQAPAYGMTTEQGIAYAYSKNKSYRECKDLEAAIRAVELAP